MAAIRDSKQQYCGLQYGYPMSKETMANFIHALVSPGITSKAIKKGKAQTAESIAVRDRSFVHRLK
jgi:hypothetical protein